MYCKLRYDIVKYDFGNYMKLIILPFTQKGREGKQTMLEKVVEVSKKIPDEKLTHIKWKAELLQLIYTIRIKKEIYENLRK